MISLFYALLVSYLCVVRGDEMSGNSQTMCIVDRIAEKVFCRGLYLTSGFVIPLEGCTDTSVSHQNQCFVCQGNLYCQGTNGYAQMGLLPYDVFNPITYSITVSTLAGEDPVVQTIAEGRTRLYRTVSGKLYLTGVYRGDDAFVSVNTFHLVAEGVSDQISSGSSHTCIILIGGVLKCAGRNAEGQIGIGYTASDVKPFTWVATAVSLVSAGSEHTCYVQMVGGVRCFGKNTAGVLSNAAVAEGGIAYTAIIPAGLQSTTGITSITSAKSHVCFTFTTNQALCFGSNLYGMYGNGDTTSLAVGSLLSFAAFDNQIASIHGFTYYTCIRTLNNFVHCAGYNNYEIFGPGTTSGPYLGAYPFVGYPYTESPSHVPTQSPVLSYRPTQQPSLSPTQNVTVPDAYLVTNEDTPLTLTLSRFALHPYYTVLKVMSLPENGQLTYEGVGVTVGQVVPVSGALVYTPELDGYSTLSESEFAVYDEFELSTVVGGTETSVPGTVYISVVAVNDVAGLSPSEIEVVSSGSRLFNFSIVDVDTESGFSFRLQSYDPSVISISRASCSNPYLPVNVSYPNPTSTLSLCIHSAVDEESYTQFELVINDGIGDSDPIRVDVHVLFSIQTCAITNCQATTSEDTSIQVTIDWVDELERGEAVTFEITQDVQKGVLVESVTPGVYTYNPNPNSNGPDSFVFRARVGLSVGPETVYLIQINQVQDAVVLDHPVFVRVCDETYTAITGLGLADVDFDEHEYEIRLELSNSRYGGGLITPDQNGVVYKKCAGLSGLGLCTKIWFRGVPSILNEVLGELVFVCTDPEMVTLSNSVEVKVVDGISGEVLQSVEIDLETESETSVLARNVQTIGVWIIIGAVSAGLGMFCFVSTCVIFACTRVQIFGARFNRALMKIEKANI